MQLTPTVPTFRVRTPRTCTTCTHTHTSVHDIALHTRHAIFNFNIPLPPQTYMLAHTKFFDGHITIKLNCDRN